MPDYEIRDGIGQHIFHHYPSEDTLMRAITNWFTQLHHEAKHIQLIKFEYFDDDNEIQATVFWGYDQTQGLTKEV